MQQKKQCNLPLSHFDITIMDLFIGCFIKKLNDNSIPLDKRKTVDESAYPVNVGIVVTWLLFEFLSQQCKAIGAQTPHGPWKYTKL